MGNSHSALSQRKTEQSQPLHSQTSDSHADARRTPSSEGTSNQAQSPGIPGGVREETMATDLAQSPATGKRKSFLNFASLRKQPPRTSVEVSDNHQTDEGANSYPTRLWRSGLRGSSRPRPTSVLVPPTSTTPPRRPSSAILSAPPASAPTTKMKGKGKARDETTSTPSASSTTPTFRGLGLHRLDEPPPVLDSDLPIAGEEMPLSEQVLIELSNLQQQHQQDEVPSIKYDTKHDVNTPPELSGNTVTPLNEKEEDPNYVLEAARAPKPIPACPIAVQPASPSSSFTRLSDTLGSWMGGISQSSESNDTALPNPNNNDNHTEVVEVVPPVSEPDVCPSSIPISLPEASTRTQTQSSNANANANTNTNANTGARRPLPPTGTGTIVVVQGVVHTADVRQSQPDSPPHHHHHHHHRPPRNISSTPALRNLFPTLPSQTRPTTPQPTSSTRNRFSSFTDTLRQRSRSRTPTSSTRNRNQNNNTPTLDDYLGVHVSEHHDRDQSVLSLGLENPASDSETSTSFTETTSSVGAVVSTDDTSTLASTLDPSVDLIARPRDDRAVNSSLNDDPSGTNNSNTSSDDEADGELSPGSIEVLGTLLSVATAATAASLVNGTTEPLFNPNLAGRLAEDSLTGSPRGVRQTPHNPSDRMRSAWDNFRDRFSRSRRRNTDGDLSTDVDDTREQMVREMARAFNLDLGGGGSNGGSGERELGSASSSDPHLAGSNSDAPEGSFEQFLHNLQVDLRTALAENYAARRSGGERAERREPNTASQTSQPESTQSPAVSDINIPQSQTQTVPTASNINPVESSIGVPYHPRSPHSATIDLPPLPAAADLPNSNERDRRPQARAITGQPGAGINWWRLYRFPPMVMASSPVNGATSSASNSDPTGLETQPPLSQSQSQSSQLNTEDVGFHMESESSDRRAESSQERQAQPQLQQQQQQQASDGSQQVVPVIVVGLQSVPVNRNGASQPEDHQFGGEAELVAENPAESTRGRSWPARAASTASRAFSRMGRRNEDGSTDQHHHRTNDNTEPRTHTGRTYLIFVIGGYYPPNHGIVTGADDMNSFEALWELAELIGQVKPQVASKEDIEQSGLEVFKASRLSEYEASHKVASNTTERCLICLDDYGSEDEIRLLSCTHAFHRNCVDRWLEQGKNNCPACRSKGVRTTDDPPVPLPSL